jgi:hypothetical protein
VRTTKIIGKTVASIQQEHHDASDYYGRNSKVFDVQRITFTDGSYIIFNAVPTEDETFVSGTYYDKNGRKVK